MINELGVIDRVPNVRELIKEHILNYFRLPVQRRPRGGWGVLPLQIPLTRNVASTNFKFRIQNDTPNKRFIVSAANKFSALLLEGLYVPNIEFMCNEDQNAITAMYLQKLPQELNKQIVINYEEIADRR